MIRTLKYRKQKKIERFEKQQFNKLFDNSQGKISDKFRDILSEYREIMISHCTKPDRDKENTGKLQERKLKNFEGRFGKI